ncbi:hypothetical protein RED65_10114 [Oceanobacter sp. RED65]|uniref:diguanylate cyclase n=2 Tax=Bermanella marisrubri TaxID=207949 RepID=Q1N653_9GAMM|nr:hypothetical protein RED65_10114 [Oceanobacter sp. RED65] [Bermanella marisrubri]
MMIGGFLFALYWMKHQKSFLYWSLSCWLFAAAELTASLRVFIDFAVVTVAIADFMIILVNVLVVQGIRCYVQPQKAHFKMFAPLLLISALALAGSLHVPDLAQFITTIIVCGLLFYSVNLLGGNHQATNQPSKILVALLSIHGLVMLLQASIIALHSFNVLAQSTSNVMPVILLIHIMLATCTALFFPLLFFMRNEDHLVGLASYDPLTGVFNRRGFFDQWQILSKRTHDKSCHLSVMMIDIDHFKHVNDKYGHEAGDAALKWLADLLAHELRENDVLARMGGEEFAVMLPGCESSQAEIVAERLRNCIFKTRFVYLNQVIPITISLGFITEDQPITDIKGLLVQADKGLYKAKDLGRNRAMRYHSGLDHTPTTWTTT